ncbi:MAG: ABC transporter ATP-binding protein [Mesotoga sp.]|uniref:ABC transporter ATP-binding protein n=1 Tax=Mesotoga sp. TaxID=2053577 RepID=UPI0026241EB1|nr:ABC transporter ATP-binding protein [Mesotoga sp.]MDD3680651.1 ABC transporter ATP-binding protein [Mesotoga sp.]MDD4206743.1 ABC transporter ATP-binding protein [Mesotoga sp.]MDD5682063.1 ABC transporter ATP-binding protein [Mesotoga sp.]
MELRPGITKRSGWSFLSEKEKINRPKITRELLLRIGSYLKPYWKQMLLVVATILMSSVLSIMPAVLTGRIIDEGLIGRDLNLLVRLLLISLAVTLGANLIGVLESYLNTWIGQHITYDMRNSMYRHLQSMPHQFFTTNHPGEIITRMTSDISGVQQLITGTLTGILSNIITLGVSLLAMYQKNWILATISIIIVPFFTLPTKRVGKARWSLTREAQARNDEVNGILNETLSVSGQLLVKLFNREEAEITRYEVANHQMIRLNIRERMAGRWFRVILGTFASIGPMLIYLVGGLLIIRYGSDLSVGDITVLVALLSRMYSPVNSLMGIQVDWIRSMALFTRIFEYFDLPVDIASDPNAVVPHSAQGNINFSHVDFAYEPDRPILRDVSFSLESGKSIAIVGPSGSGKSTISNLIPRLYDVSKGSITFDGIDVRKLDLGWLRQNVAIVTQETYLFNGTIRDNLLYAKPMAMEDELVSACIKANIYDFISKQPIGFDTLVGNRGLKLSGGEKQRISIARALLKDPAVLIFDEATSSLDSISEQLIQKAIDPLISTRTSIIIAHRLSTILAADEILVMKEGRIAERGTHTDLLEAGGGYTELYETQFSGALEPRE